MHSAQSFNVRSWSNDGLVYFAISEVNGADLDAAGVDEESGGDSWIS